MKTRQMTDERIDRLLGHYGDGVDGSAPTAEQWRHVFERPADRPITLINFFKMRSRAAYPQGVSAAEAEATGQEAFARYSEVSIPTVEKVDGRFLLVAPLEAMFLGGAEDWDLVAIGSYADTTALLALFEDPGYQAVSHHRAAACERQKVLICAA